MEKVEEHENNNECKPCAIDGVPCPHCKCKQCGMYVQWLTNELFEIFNCRD